MLQYKIFVLFSIFFFFISKINKFKLHGKVFIPHTHTHADWEKGFANYGLLLLYDILQVASYNRFEVELTDSIKPDDWSIAIDENVMNVIFLVGWN